MAKKQSLSHMAKKKTNEEDLCPVCEGDLYHNEKYTKRIGIVDITGNHDVIGWICPHCKSEFDTNNHLTKFLGEGNIRGEA